MPIVLTCTRCGGELPPLTEEEEKLLRSGKPFTAAHDVCPVDRPAFEAARKQRRFEARVRIVEVIERSPAAAPTGLYVPGGETIAAPATEVAQDPEVVELAGFTAWVDGPNLPDSMRPLAQALGERWMEVEKNAPLVDMPDLADVERPAEGAG